MGTFNPIVIYLAPNRGDGIYLHWKSMSSPLKIHMQLIATWGTVLSNQNTAGFKKVFDNVYQEILLDVLEYYSGRDHSYKFYRSYRAIRHQYTIDNGMKSVCGFVKRGMMTSSNGNIFRVTGPLCGEFTGHR